MGNKPKINTLHKMAQFAMFVSSYLPLFVLIVSKQISDNYEYLNWGGINWNGVKVFVLKFGLSVILITTSIVGFIGYRLTLKNIEQNSENGVPVTIKDVKNKNSEAIGYIATYIIPFLFQRFDGWYECLSVLFLMVIIYRIYIHSSLILINPLLSVRFAIYEVEYSENNKKKNGMIISRNKSLQDDEKIKIYEIGHKLFFAKELK